MKTEENIQVFRFLFMVFNGVFVILGLAIFGCGLWILFDKNNIILTVSSEESIRIIAGGLFIIGMLVLTVSAFGYLGALKEVRCILLLYITFLVVIFLGQLFVALIVLVKKAQITETMLKGIDEIIQNYGNTTEIEEHHWDLLDSVQYYWNCCGRINSSQWENNYFIKSRPETNVYPCSCFNTSNSNNCPPFIGDSIQRFGKGNAVYSMGCQILLEEWISQNALVIFGMSSGLIFIQIFLFVFAIYLYRNITKKVKQSQDRQTFSAQKDHYGNNSAFEDLG